MAQEQQIHVDDFTPDAAPASDLSKYDKYKVNAQPTQQSITPVTGKDFGPPAAKPPLPWDLRTDAQKHQSEVDRNAKLKAQGGPKFPFSPTQAFTSQISNAPVIGGVIQAGEGLRDAVTATSGPQVAQGATKAIGGVVDAALPLAGESILAKPAEALIAGATGWATQEATQAGLKKLGIKPEYADLAGTLTGLLSGYAAGKIRLDPEQTTLVEALQGKEANTPEAKTKRVNDLRTAATDPNRTQNERDAASALLKRNHGIEQPAFKPDEPVKATEPGKTKTPPVVRKTAAPPVKTPVEGTKPLWPKPNTEKPSLDQDVAVKPETPAPAPVTPEAVAETPAPVEAPPEAPATPEATPEEKKPVIWKSGDAVPDYSEVVNMNPHDLIPKPAVFQYKQEAVGKGGTTDEFRDVQEWNPGLAGAMAVWQDPVTGEVSPVNGHHRTEMAQRLNPEFVNVRFIPAKTAEEARTYGAFLNIGEGKGTAIDAAKLFRDSKEKITPEDLDKYGIAPDSKLATQGLGLSKLDQSIFNQVVQGKMTPTRGALIGDLLEGNYEAQKAAVDFFKQQDKSGTRYTNAEASDIIQSIKAAPDQTEEIETLFGVDEIKKNLFGERGQVSAAIGKKLGKEKSLFGLVGKSSVASKLSGAGNIINAEENAKISKEAAQVLAVYEKLKFSAGPVSDALNDAAKEVASGTDIDIATDKAYERIKEAVQSELSGKPVKPPAKQEPAKSEPESGKPAVQAPVADEPGEADKGGSGAGVEDKGKDVAPAEEDFTPDPVTKPVKLNDPTDDQIDYGNNTIDTEGTEEAKEPEKKAIDPAIYQIGNKIHDKNWKEDLMIVNSMPAIGGGTEYQVVQLDNNGDPKPSSSGWWIKPDERYELKEADPQKAPAKAPEPAKLQPSLTINQLSQMSKGDDWLPNWFKPGNVVYSGYWGDYDSVLEFKDSTQGENPAGGWGGWSVKVVRSNTKGEPLPGEKPRWHSTPPDVKDRLIKYDPSILEKPAKPEPVPAPAVLPKIGKTKAPPNVQGFKKPLVIPKKFTMNVPERKLIFGSTDTNELNDKSVDAKVTVMNLLVPAIEHLPIPESLKGIYFSGYGSASYTEHQKLVAGLVQVWAGTSADSDKNSLAIQIAAQKEFGSSSGWDFKANKADSYALNDAYDLYGKAGTLLRTFLRAQYNETQKFFKDNGIKSVTAYRGMQFNNTQATPLKSPYGEAKYLKSAKSLLQPLSSFSLYPETAASFTSGKTGALIAAEIPVSRILSTPKTGMGCLYEYEILVMGGDESKNNIVGVSWNEFTPPNQYSSFLIETQQIEMLRLMMGEIEANAGKPKPKLGKGSPKKPGN